jgi:hypothetical protein
MPLHVQAEVVGAAEGSLAKSALKGAVAGVLAVMPRQFVRTREFPPATFPVALVGLFPGVGPHMGLEV